MHSSSLILFAVVLIIALYTSPISGKATKKPATTAAATTTTTTTTTTTLATTKVIATVKPAKVDKKKKKGRKKRYRHILNRTETLYLDFSFSSKKPKKNPWSIPNADQKKLFNDVRLSSSHLFPSSNFYSSTKLSSVRSSMLAI